MFREDYLMRHIQSLADAVARILGLNEREEYDRALAAAEQAWQELLDVPGALIRAIDTATLVGMLREPAKLRLAARLFREEARALAGRGEPARAAVRSRRALELLLEARSIDPGERAADDTAIAELSHAVPVDALAARYRTLLQPGS
ncbi:MAG: hypothetical protein E6J90_24065 [Deltaproteobacteria bacterium]|nr:MAG: hypothetical protein E6J91_30855 [Deltaproteobacteria bacterium]TMQ16329.1 MAG: hypothetical protein E6J90_24065 [Deltaproteobacteria bacterium]